MQILLKKNNKERIKKLGEAVPIAAQRLGYSVRQIVKFKKK